MINSAEMAALGAGFSRTEIIESTVGNVTTKTIYAGHSPAPEVTEATLQKTGWLIRKTIVTEDPDHNTTNVVELWGNGSWTGRASISYRYNM